jgi:hypothetical protein
MDQGMGVRVSYWVVGTNPPPTSNYSTLAGARIKAKVLQKLQPIFLRFFELSCAAIDPKIGAIGHGFFCPAP